MAMVNMHEYAAIIEPRMQKYQHTKDWNGGEH